VEKSVHFLLDERLARDSFSIGDFPLCGVLLMNDARFPWLILVPRRKGLIEIVDLNRTDRMALMDEIALASEALRALPEVDKINVGALGNIVRQLHITSSRAGSATPRGPGRSGERGRRALMKMALAWSLPRG
jgi:diadenosine tetraphosphate (Ap4A) HIT family hydrolase